MKDKQLEGKETGDAIYIPSRSNIYQATYLFLELPNRAMKNGCRVLEDLRIKYSRDG